MKKLVKYNEYSIGGISSSSNSPYSITVKSNFNIRKLVEFLESLNFEIEDKENLSGFSTFPTDILVKNDGRLDELKKSLEDYPGIVSVKISGYGTANFC